MIYFYLLAVEFSGLKVDHSPDGGGFGWMDGFHDSQTFSQETTVHVPFDIKSQRWLILTYVMHFTYVTYIINLFEPEPLPFPKPNQG